MATISYTVYHADDMHAVERTCQYVLNNHGLDPYSVIAKYAVTGHEGLLFAKGHHVVADPELCPIQMRAYKKAYKQKHPITRGTNESRRDIDLIQFYVSLPETEKLGYEAYMEIIEEFIDKTDLKDFPILISIHQNSNCIHAHLVLSPYSSKLCNRKFALNKEKLYELRRNMDYICVEHGLSIVEPELALLRDPEYKMFYEKVVAEQLVPVHPREKNQKKMSRRKRSMQAAMDRAAVKKQLQEEAKREAEKKRRRAANYYTHPNAYRPNSRKQLYVCKYDETGRERSVVELMLILLFTMANAYGEAERQIKPQNIYQARQQDMYFGKIDTVAQRSMDALMLSYKYDVKTTTDIQAAKSSIGDQMNHCKAVMKAHNVQLEAVQRELSNKMDISPEDLEYKKLVKTNEILERNVEYQKQRLNELNKEYRDMSWLGATLEREQFANELQSIRYLDEQRQKQRERKKTDLHETTHMMTNRRNIELER